MAEGKKAVSDLKWLVIFAALMVLPWVLLLGWLGFLPVVSNLLVARAPQNLGVKYAVTDLKSFEAKSGMTVSPPPSQPPVSNAQPGGVPPASVTPSPAPAAPVSPKPLDMTVSQEELSAVIATLPKARLSDTGRPHPSYRDGYTVNSACA